MPKFLFSTLKASCDVIFSGIFWVHANGGRINGGIACGRANGACLHIFVRFCVFWCLSASFTKLRGSVQTCAIALLCNTPFNYTPFCISPSFLCISLARIGVPQTVPLVNRAFVPCQEEGCDENGTKWQIYVLTSTTRLCCSDPMKRRKWRKWRASRGQRYGLPKAWLFCSLTERIASLHGCALFSFRPSRKTNE